MNRPSEAVDFDYQWGRRDALKDARAVLVQAVENVKAWMPGSWHTTAQVGDAVLREFNRLMEGEK